METRFKNKCKLDKERVVVLGTAAAIDTRYKGQEFVIKAIGKLKKRGYQFEYRLAGGTTREKSTTEQYLKQLASKCGVENEIIFLGALSQNELVYFYDSLDIYVQPSKQEGLPRAVIEAMSHGCPIIGSDIAGIPELVSKDFLFKKANVNQIIKKILYVVESDLEEISRENFLKSKKYSKDILKTKREKFYDLFIEMEKKPNYQ